MRYPYKATVAVPVSPGNPATHAMEVMVTANDAFDAQLMFQAQYGRILSGPVQVLTKTKSGMYSSNSS